MKRSDLVALSELAEEQGWPSRAFLFKLVTDSKIQRFKFRGDRKTYVHRADLEKVMSTPQKRKGRK